MTPKARETPAGSALPVARWPLALAWALLIAALAWGLGSYPLLDPDEGRNAEVAREMAATLDFGLPHLDGLPYLDKPVAFFAADALAQRLLGANEMAARLPSLLFALATAALTGWFAGRLFGPRARGIAALAALAAPLPIAFARTVIFDSMLAFCMVLALCAFWLAIEARRGATPAAETSAAAPRYLGWTVLAWAAIGAGILTKGPVALAVPLLAAIPYAIYRRASLAVWHPLGPLAMALLVAPWLWWVSLQVPEFMHYALITETWERVATPAMNREGPIWLYLPVLLAGAMPWSFLVIAGARRSLRFRESTRRLDPVLLYLALWIVVPFVMFSLSHSKRPQYILPLLPAVALLAAKVWVESTGSLSRFPGRRTTAVTWLTLAILCAIAVPVLARAHVAALAHSTRLPATLLWLAAAFATGALILYLAGRRRSDDDATSPLAGRRLVLLGLVVPIAALPAISLPLMGEIGVHRSSRDAAASILRVLPPAGGIVGVHAYPPSLPFYLRRTILVASPHGRELTSNYVIAYFDKWLAAPPDATPLRPLEWWRTALATCDSPRVFVTWMDDTASHDLLTAAGLPLIASNDRMAAYGPCKSPVPAASGSPLGKPMKAGTAAAATGPTRED